MTGRGKRLAIITAVALAGAVLIVVLTLQLASSPDVNANLGDDEFNAGGADRMARLVRQDGPVLLPDLRNGDLHIYLQHLGDDSSSGWFAFEARAPGAPRRCQLQWQEARGRFTDPCDRRSYPADGSGLRQFAVRVDGGEVFVDLRSRPRATTTTTTVSGP